MKALAIICLLFAACSSPTEPEWPEWLPRECVFNGKPFYFVITLPLGTTVSGTDGCMKVEYYDPDTMPGG